MKVASACQGGLVCQAHRLLYHSTLGMRVIQKKKKGESLMVESGERVLDGVPLCSPEAREARHLRSVFRIWDFGFRV